MSSTVAPWSGRRVTQAREILGTRTAWPTACGQCGHLVQRDEPWVVGHIVARSLDPSLVWRVSNWRVEHRGCSDASAQQAVIDKAFAAGRESVSSHDETARQTPLLPVPPSGAHQRPQEVRSALKWTSPAQTSPEWLQDVRAVPGDAAAPMAITAPHPEAVGSYGLQAIEWAREVGLAPRGLRWWQRLSLLRALEHRADGSLCWKTVILSASRRSGKSLLMRVLACWRMAHPEIFEEPQTVVHTASDVSLAREIQRGAWPFADARGWTISKANGKESLEAAGGHRWLVRAGEATTGYDVSLALADECWKIPPTIIDDNLEPATLERISPQLWLVSTAHRRATALMRARISGALAIDDEKTLLLLWAAPSGADFSDPAVWKAASPYWSEDRAETLAVKYAAALSGEADAEMGEAPMDSFTSQLLNVWRLTERKPPPGTPVVEPESWADLVALVDVEETPDAVALEDDFGQEVSLALAWRTDSTSTVSVTDHPDVASAVEAIRETGYRGSLTVGSSLADDSLLRGLRLRLLPLKTRAPMAVADLARTLTEGTLQHDGGEHLTGQVLAVRTQPGADGPRVVSKGRTDAIKAAVWAATAARSKRSGKARIVLPTNV